MLKSKWPGGEVPVSCFVTHVVTPQALPVLPLVGDGLGKLGASRRATNKVLSPVPPGFA